MTTDKQCANCAGKGALQAHEHAPACIACHGTGQAPEPERCGKCGGEWNPNGGWGPCTACTAAGRSAYKAAPAKPATGGEACARKSCRHPESMHERSGDCSGCSCLVFVSTCAPKAEADAGAAKVPTSLGRTLQALSRLVAFANGGEPNELGLEAIDRDEEAVKYALRIADQQAHRSGYELAVRRLRERADAVRKEDTDLFSPSRLPSHLREQHDMLYRAADWLEKEQDR